jgi:hypothetical protein
MNNHKTMTESFNGEYTRYSSAAVLQQVLSSTGVTGRRGCSSLARFSIACVALPFTGVCSSAAPAAVHRGALAAGRAVDDSGLRYCTS